MSRFSPSFFFPSCGDISLAQHSYLLSFSALTQSVFPYSVANFLQPERLSDCDQAQLAEWSQAQDDPYQAYVSILVDAILQQIDSQPNGTWRWLLNNDYDESNGVRGVSRFDAHETKVAFLLECDVIKETQKRLADPTQLELVVPFVRTVSEAAKAIDVLAGQGLARGANGLKVHLWCELPNNALLIDKFLPYFDGLMLDEVGLMQTTLSADLSNTALQELFDVPDEGVRQLILRILNGAEKAKKTCDWVQRDQSILFEPIKESWTVNQFYRLP